MFNNQFIFSKIKFLIFFYKKKYFSNLNRVWDRVGDTRYPTGTQQVRGRDNKLKPVGYRIQVWGYVGESG